jgi:hypothetical protein
MEQPHADDLIPLMPESVLEEYVATGGGLFGLSDGVKDWIKKSTNPTVEKWRDDLKLWAALQFEAALKWQEKAVDLAHQFPASDGSIREVTVPIHPLIKAWMETKDRNAWKDPDSLADTRRNHPKLFRR